jgi:subtilisin
VEGVRNVKRLFVLAVVVLAALAMGAAAAAKQSVPPDLAGAPKVRVFVSFEKSPGAAEQRLVRELGGRVRYSYHLVPAMALELPLPAVELLRAQPGVLRVEEDGVVHALDAELDNSWGVKRIGAGVVHAYNKGTGIKISIIDSGINCSHPDLYSNCAGGYDFVNGDPDPADDNGHGTHVAGIACAEDDDNGVVGVAPECALYALKVLDAGGYGNWSDIIAALQWSVDEDVQVANLSLGSRINPGGTVHDAFTAAYEEGLLIVAAAGNSGNCRGVGDNVEYPARYDEVIAVAATDQNDQRPCFSSTGDQVELSAPGVNVNSTWLGSGYHVGTGTSMASPHVAGTAALVIASGITSNVEVRRILRDTADDLGVTGKDNQFGYGLVDADEAAPESGTEPTPTPTPTATPSEPQPTPTPTPCPPGWYRNGRCPPA